MERIYYGYDAFVADSKILTEKIDQHFDAIIAIARGGMTLAHLLGEYYDLRSVYTINTVGYEDIEKLANVKVFNIPKLSNAKSVLIVDDIVDSGDTMIAVLKVLSTQYPDIHFQTASLFYKKSAKIAPTWYAKEAKEWIDFFWTVDLKGKV